MKKILLLLSIISFGITQAQIVNIPDVNFKYALLNNDTIIDINGDEEIQISEAEAVLNLDISVIGDIGSLGIIDLTGIGAFTNLTELNCSYNLITNIDLSNNLKLTYLNCSNNNLSNLELSNNLLLTTLVCDGNSIENLDLSNNLGLIYLRCSDNNINLLNIINNNLLERLLCSHNNLNNIDLSANINLLNLSCSNNNLTNLDVTNNTSLTSISCKNNYLTTINTITNISLSTLFCSYNSLENIDLSMNTSLNKLQCNNNNLLTINLKNGNNQNFIYDDFVSFMNLPNLETVCLDNINSELANFILNEVNHEINFLDNCVLSINENKNFTFSVYPIPTDNILNIKSKTEISKIEIYNKLGQLMLLNETENNIDISNLTNGLYFVKVEDIDGDFGVKKIMKK